MQLFIRPSGTVDGLYGEELDLSALGRLTIRRASHVEPSASGGWTADLSPIGGPLLGPFALRSQALAAECAWINEQIAVAH